VVLVVNDGTELKVPVTVRDKNHPFSTGSTGYHAAGKIAINGDSFQVHANIVKIGSKSEE
jgi:hypothetical protein